MKSKTFYENHGDIRRKFLFGDLAIDEKYYYRNHNGNEP
jgi:hypothetical protein